MISLIILMTIANNSWSIQLDDYKVYHEGLVAVSEQNVLCVAIPHNSELLFFDSKANLILRHKQDNDSPTGFRQISGLGFQPETKCFYVYDFGRKISYWNEFGLFKGVQYLNPLLKNVQMIANNELVYVQDISGAKGSTPSLMWLSLERNTTKALDRLPPLQKINGYASKTTQRPPLKLPWHHQFLISCGHHFFAACYNSSGRIDLYNTNTLRLSKTIVTRMPLVPVDDKYYKETLKEVARQEMVSPQHFVLDRQIVHFPAPLRVLMDTKDRVFVYGKGFEKNLRIQYDHNGSILGKKTIGRIPICINRQYHYDSWLDVGQRLVITREVAP